MRLREIPVIMISAVDEMDSVVRCIEGGAEDHLPKPFNAALLRARVHARLEKKRLRDQEAGYLKQIEVEKKRADDLLHATLPAAAVHELKATNVVRPRRFEDVAVLFCDVVGYSTRAMTAYGTKREFSQERLKGRKPPHCRRSGLNVGSSPHCRPSPEGWRRSVHDPRRKLPPSSTSTASSP